MSLATVTIASPLGPLCLAACDAGLCLCEFEGQPDEVSADSAQSPAVKTDDAEQVAARQARIERELADLAELVESPTTSIAERVLEDAAAALDRYFAGSDLSLNIPLHFPGSPWQRQVWAALQDIPLGTTMSYGELATTLDSPGAARAVGLANGQNRLGIFIPCHRVIDASGSLRGYAGGLHRKAWLLDHERAALGQSLFA